MEAREEERAYEASCGRRDARFPRARKEEDEKYEAEKPHDEKQTREQQDRGSFVQGGILLLSISAENHVIL